MRLALVANPTKSGALIKANEVALWLQEKGIEVYSPKQPFDLTEDGMLESFLKDIKMPLDALLVLGGDGTLLGAARRIAKLNLPLLGINMGRIGFLAEIEPSEIYSSLEKLLSGSYYIEDRMMIQVSIIRNGQCIGTYNCLNDAVVMKGKFAGVANLSILIDSRPSGSYHADGLIVATPTGASAYSLSSGGPLISPEMSVMIITPICPQSLYSRSLVIDPNRRVTLEICDQEMEINLSIDGQVGIPLKPNDVVEVVRSEWVTGMIRLNNKTFFEVLNEKLRDRG